MKTHSEDVCGTAAAQVHSSFTSSRVVVNESEQEYFIKAGSAGLVKLFSASCVMKAMHTHFH